MAPHSSTTAVAAQTRHLPPSTTPRRAVSDSTSTSATFTTNRSTSTSTSRPQHRHQNSERQPPITTSSSSSSTVQSTAATGNITTPLARSRQYTHLHAQLAQLNAHLADTENLLHMTAVQADNIRGLGAWWGGAFMAASKILGEETAGGGTADAGANGAEGVGGEEWGKGKGWGGERGGG